MKLTPAEEKVIAALQELAKEFPKTLLLGGSCKSSNISVWKRISPSEYESVVEIKIKNLDA
jgi:hypothetical protein